MQTFFNKSSLISFFNTTTEFTSGSLYYDKIVVPATNKWGSALCDVYGK